MLVKKTPLSRLKKIKKRFNALNGKHIQVFVSIKGTEESLYVCLD